VVIRRIEPGSTKGIIGGQQPFHVAAHRLLRAEALDTHLRAFAVQFIGIGRDVPCFRRYVEKLSIPRKRVEQFHGWRGGDD
jgi:hypothetical protein